MLLHFSNKRSLSLNSRNEVGDGKVFADGLAAAFEKFDLRFI
jgi:hypothetical protein